MPPEDTNSDDISPFAEGFNEWLREFSAEVGQDGPDSIDLITVVMNCIVKMRAVLTHEEVHHAIHNAVEFTEQKVQAAGLILAEHWRDQGEEGYQMYVEANQAEAPDDASALFENLNGQGEIPPDVLERD